MNSELVLKPSVDFERIVVEGAIKTIRHIQKALAAETRLEIQGCEDQIKIAELLAQHEEEQHTLKNALKIIMDYTGVKSEN